jgi:hypothetical protein
MLLEDPIDGPGDGQAVKPSQIIGDLAGAKVVALSEVQDLADDLARSNSWRSMWRTWPVAETRFPPRL